MVLTGTVNAFQHCRDSGIQVMLALSKMDRPFLRVEDVLQDVEDEMGMKPIQIYHTSDDNGSGGEDGSFQGVVPLFLLDEGGNLKKNDDNVDGLEEAWTVLEEAVAMTSDDLLVDYLEEGRLDTDRVLAGLRAAVMQRKILPLVYTSAERDLGVSELMDAVVTVLPDPIEVREEALKAACKWDELKCDLIPGVENGFAARVLHTTVDSFGSLSILRRTSLLRLTINNSE
jgi:elongation factor G